MHFEGHRLRRGLRSRAVARLNLVFALGGVTFGVLAAIPVDDAVALRSALAAVAVVLVAVWIVQASVSYVVTTHGFESRLGPVKLGEHGVNDAAITYDASYRAFPQVILLRPPRLPERKPALGIPPRRQPVLRETDTALGLAELIGETRARQWAVLLEIPFLDPRAPDGSSTTT